VNTVSCAFAASCYSLIHIAKVMFDDLCDAYCFCYDMTVYMHCCK